VNKDISLRSSSFYIRFQLKDKSGVIALLSTKLSSNKISINQMKQKALSKGKASLIITTHKTSQKNLEEALGEIKRSKICFSEPVSIRIEDI
jgi:homoserine dehydrogenase